MGVVEDTILDLLASRAPGATICPSEAARQLGDEDTWREFMQPVRRTAREMVARGELDITQHGRPVTDPAATRGAIRLRLPS